MSMTEASLQRLRKIVGEIDDVACIMDEAPMGSHSMLGDVFDLLDEARSIEQELERLHEADEG
jgi:hypothetical protein